MFDELTEVKCFKEKTIQKSCNVNSQKQILKVL